MRFRKKVLLTLLLVIIAAGAGLWAWRAHVIQQYFVAPLNADLVLTIDRTQLPAVVYEQHVKLTGSTSIPSQIKVEQNGNVIAETRTDGDFGVDVTLRPGDNSLRVIANSSVGWHELEKEGYVNVEYQPQKPSTPVLMPHPGSVNSAAVHVNGVADPSLELDILIERRLKEVNQDASPAADLPASNASSTSTQSNENGRFDADISLPEEGVYRITAQARNNKGQHSDVSNALEIKYDKGFYAQLPPTKRTTNISIGYREIRTDLEATLANDDPMVRSLIEGRITTPEFVLTVFGYLMINDQALLNDVDIDTTPTYVVGDKLTTVKLSTIETSSNLSLPAFSGQIKISRAFGIDTVRDILKLTVKDYRLHSVSPLPSNLEGNQAVWIGDKAAAIDRLDGISAQLSSDPSANPLRVLQLTPLVFTSSRVALILGMIRDALPVIPLIWFLLLLRRKNENPVKSWISELSKNTNRLLILIILPLVLRAVSINWFRFTGFSISEWIQHLAGLITGSSISEWIQHLAGLITGSSNSEWIPYLAGLIATAAVFLLLIGSAIVIARVRSGSVFAYVLKSISKALIGAWLIILLACLCLLAVRTYGISGYPLLTMVLATPVLIIFLAAFFRWSKWVWRCQDNLGAVKLGHGTRFLVFAVALLLSYPGQNILFRIYNIPTWQKLWWAWEQFFVQLSNVAPYALVPLVLVFLRKVDVSDPCAAAEQTDRVLALTAGALLFSSYLVGVDPSWFWLPIPFLLSLYVFPRWVLLPEKTQIAIDEIAGELRSRRGALICELKGRANLRQLQEALAKLEKKFNNGDLSLTDFESRSKQIEDYVQKQEAPWSDRTTLKTKDLVMAIGPFDSNWENAWWAAKKSIYLLTPLLIIYVSIFLLKDIHSYYSHFYLWFVARLANFVLDGIVGAIFFGFFFKSIRGSSGLKKGMNVSLAIIVCLLPSWIAPLSSSSVTNLIALLFRAAQTFLFFTILGIWAFDYKIYHDAVGEQFQWKKFAKFGDMPGATAFISVLLTSAGVTLTTVLTGQFSSIITQIIKAALPVMPIPPK